MTRNCSAFNYPGSDKVKSVWELACSSAIDFSPLSLPHKWTWGHGSRVFPLFGLLPFFFLPFFFFLLIWKETSGIWGINWKFIKAGCVSGWLTSHNCCLGTRRGQVLAKTPPPPHPWALATLFHFLPITFGLSRRKWHDKFLTSLSSHWLYL